ncbi:MAG: hypothetical protein AAF619_06890 [Pseudomonadota bacterium]
MSKRRVLLAVIAGTFVGAVLIVLAFVIEAWISDEIISEGGHRSVDLILSEPFQQLAPVFFVSLVGMIICMVLFGLPAWAALRRLQADTVRNAILLGAGIPLGLLIAWALFVFLQAPLVWVSASEMVSWFLPDPPFLVLPLIGAVTGLVVHRITYG